MNVRAILVLLMILCFLTGCAAASTPTPTRLPTPTPIPLPTATLMPPTALLPTPIGRGNAPTDVPACKDAKSLDQPVKFSWAGIEDIVRDTPESNWTYYGCGQSQAAMSTFYRLWMPKPPYNWLEAYWEERPEATMAVYFHKDPDRWLYLWFLREKSNEPTSDLVAAWWNVPKSC